MRQAKTEDEGRSLTVVITEPSPHPIISRCSMSPTAPSKGRAIAYGEDGQEEGIVPAGALDLAPYGGWGLDGRAGC